MKLLSKLSKKTAHERVWYCLLPLISLFARLVILIVPFKYLSRLIGNSAIEDEHHVTNTESSNKALAVSIGETVRHVSHYMLWESSCLTQALMTKCLLLYYKIPHTIHFGVRLSEEASPKINAHAWVVANNEVITGKKNYKKYKILSSFVAPIES
ncbi:lasso peptide biosynthesis B2 protein [Pleionea sp. CnH1-48]|uniref:lasso peptide biosynthesis B2 protein n=1 Tax=Pleionea sp. CnH1-48 TaxID=2954494 RepID=UPI002097BFBD|nr:lasso peptide biosynthesis B2 protein [Pleionea sp. CnH1-48]MCO7227291.1 lasso peptide biosynthesis B2 protein [Pleionea sp. CnH1-48]